MGFLFADLSCTATGAGTSATPASGNATMTASITIAGGGPATCTYTNNQQLGAILVTKTRKHAAGGSGDQPHPGVTFTVKQGATTITSGIDRQPTGRSASATCRMGAYTVTETVPAGYVLDAAGQ